MSSLLFSPTLPLLFGPFLEELADVTWQDAEIRNIKIIKE